MLDEGLRSDEDVEQLARLGAPYMAHLKIAKLGAPVRLLQSPAACGPRASV